MILSYDVSPLSWLCPAGLYPVSGYLMNKIFLTAALCALFALGPSSFAQPAPQASAAVAEPSDALIDFLSTPDFSPQQQKRLQQALQHKQMVPRVAAFAGLTRTQLEALPSERQFCLLSGYLLQQELAAQQRPASQLAQARGWLLSPGWCERVSREQAQGMTQEDVLGIDGVVTLYYLLYLDMQPRLAGG